MTVLRGTRNAKTEPTPNSAHMLPDDVWGPIMLFLSIGMSMGVAFLINLILF
jgi:hypothetical protein